MSGRVDTKAVILAGQTYTAYHYPDWNIWYLLAAPPGWLPITEMAPRYGVPRDKLMRNVYAEHVPGFRVEMGDRFTWHVAPPAPDYVPPAPAPPPVSRTVTEDLRGLPTVYRKALRHAGIRTRTAVAAMDDADLLAVRWIGRKGLQLIRAAIPFEPPAPPPIATPLGSQTYQIECPCCHGTGRLEVAIPAAAPETTQMLDKLRESVLE